MFIAIILLMASLLFIYSEFFLPGGIMGVIGGIAFITSIFLFAEESTSMTQVLIFIGAGLVGLILTVKWALYQIQHSPSKSGGVYLDADQEGFYAPSYDEALVGKNGVSDTPLRPSGYIKVDGKRVQALSQSGFIEKGVEVRVVSGEGAHLLVKPSKMEKIS